MAQKRRRNRFQVNWICLQLSEHIFSQTAIRYSDLDSRFRIIGTGSLQISSVEDVDSGDYQCRGSNSVDSLDASATLNVHIPPKFALAPADKIANEKDELELPCAIHGKPSPVIQWLKNGDLITPNDYMQITNGYDNWLSSEVR